MTSMRRLTHCSPKPTTRPRGLLAPLPSTWTGRDAILEQLDRDPIIAHTNKAGQRVSATKLVMMAGACCLPHIEPKGREEVIAITS